MFEGRFHLILGINISAMRLTSSKIDSTNSVLNVMDHFDKKTKEKTENQVVSDTLCRYFQILSTGGIFEKVRKKFFKVTAVLFSRIQIEEEAVEGEKYKPRKFHIHIHNFFLKMTHLYVTFCMLLLLRSLKFKTYNIMTEIRISATKSFKDDVLSFRRILSQVVLEVLILIFQWKQPRSKENLRYV